MGELSNKNLSVLRYWNRLLKKDNSTLSKHVFLWDYRLCNKIGVHPTDI